jgi:hypothetical protein
MYSLSFFSLNTTYEWHKTRSAASPGKDDKYEWVGGINNSQEVSLI